MKCNLTEIKSKLLSNQGVLLDPTYLKDDMTALYEYYEGDDIKPPLIDHYFSDNKEFKLLEFTKSYFEATLGINIQITKTVDGWIKLTNITSNGTN